MDVTLNIVNQSNDQNNSIIAIFASDVATDASALREPWLVIRNLGQGGRHAITLPEASFIDVHDADGNTSQRLAASAGEMFSYVMTTSGHQLQLSGTGGNPDAIGVVNALPQGAIDVYAYKAGGVFAAVHGLAPGQQAAIVFKPTIWIGVASQIALGESVNAAILSSVNTEISLLGIASADIVMTGGGPGPNSTPFQFTLANVVTA